MRTRFKLKDCRLVVGLLVFSLRLAAAPVVFKSVQASFLILTCLITSGQEVARQSQFNTSDSAIQLDPHGVNLLMASWSAHATPLKVFNPDPSGLGAKNFWLDGRLGPESEVRWKIRTAGSSRYQITLMIHAAKDSVLKISCGTEVKELKLQENGWQRVAHPDLFTLAAGGHTLRISATHQVAVAFKSAELCAEAYLPVLRKQIQDLKGDVSWMKSVGYGIMVQTGGWSYPQHGAKKPWPGFAEDFDAAAFVQKVDEMGGKFLLWSVTWMDYLIPAPIEAVREILPDRVSKRDLIAELTQECKKRNIRFMMYYHMGHGLPEVLVAKGWPTNWAEQGHQRQVWFERELKILSEISQRYGEGLDGWFIDDACAWYPCDFFALATALKNGNSKRVVGFNSWDAPRHTEFQDFYCGEDFNGEHLPANLQQGIAIDGPQNGLQFWGCFRFDGEWGVYRQDTPLSDPKGWTVDRLRKLTQNLEANQYSVAINLTLYEDGSVNPKSYHLLRENAKLTGRGPWKK